MPRFQYCLGLNENLMKIRAIQGHTGGDLVDPEVLNYVGTSAWMERVLVPCRRFTPRALHHASRAPRRWKGHQRRTADCLLYSSGPLGDELDEEYEDLHKTMKSTLRKQVRSISGRDLLDQSEKSTR